MRRSNERQRRDAISAAEINCCRSAAHAEQDTPAVEAPEPWSVDTPGTESPELAHFATPLQFFRSDHPPPSSSEEKRKKKPRAYRYIHTYIFFSVSPVCACMQSGVLAPPAPLPAKPADSVCAQSAPRSPYVRKVPKSPPAREILKKRALPAAKTWYKKSVRASVTVLIFNKQTNCTLGLARLFSNVDSHMIYVIFMCCYTRRKYITTTTTTLVPAPLNKVNLFLSNFLAPWCELVEPCR